MMWLTWRLQRVEFALLVAICAALAGLLVFSHQDVVQQASRSIGGDCFVSLNSPEAVCFAQPGALYRVVDQALGWLNFVPLIAALLLALPVINELEHGTHRLVWTQSITRSTWARIRLGLPFLAGIAFAGALGYAFNWWAAPRDPYMGKMGQDTYDLRGVLPIGHTVFALGLALALGALLKRPGLTIAVASVAFVVIRVAFNIFLLPHLLPARTRTASPLAAPHPEDWFLSTYFVDATGKRYSESDVFQLCPPKFDPGACLAEHGLLAVEKYHPASHYWPLQLIEAGMYFAAGLALAGFAAWYLMRRVE